VRAGLEKYLCWDIKMTNMNGFGGPGPVRLQSQRLFKTQSFLKAFPLSPVFPFPDFDFYTSIPVSESALTYLLTYLPSCL
jgi:hypothetical protein